MSKRKTEQIANWAGRFGKEYTDRNYLLPEDFDELYLSEIGVSRTKQIEGFLSNLELNKILEVGCNIANQLLLLQKSYFKSSHLYGIELNRYAIEKSKPKVAGKGIDIFHASAFHLPFKDACVIYIPEVSPKELYLDR